MQAALDDGGGEQALTGAVGLTDRLLLQYPQAPEAEQALALRGEIHYLLGDYETAAQDYTRYLQGYPSGTGLALAEERLINALLETGRPRDALTEWDRAAAIDPGRLSDVNALMQRAGALLAAGDHQTAAASYLDIINRVPGTEPSPRAHLAAGLCLERLNRWPEALPVYEALMRAWPQSSEARLAGDRSLAIRRFLATVEAFR